MNFDLIVRNASLKDGRVGMNLGIQHGKIVAVEPELAATAHQTIDAEGMLVIPPFVDPHFHLDATLSLGRPRLNQSGTLLEGIKLWGELRAEQTIAEITNRALKYCDLAVSQGLLAVRTHVDICDDELKAVHALIDVQATVKDYLDLQLVAFPQDGFFRSPNAQKNLNRALDLGVNVVGGIPHFERTMEAGTQSVQALCLIAAKRGLPVDMHCDETDDPLSRHIETLAFEAQRLGLQQVVGSHLTSMHSMDNYYVSKLLPLIAEAGVAVVANPLINITLQGRHDSYPKRRGLTRVKEMREYGIGIAFGSDCMMDPWYPLGTADMLEVASMGLHVGQLTSQEEIRWCLDAVTELPASILGLQDYGLAPGCNADLVILQANSPLEALRIKPPRLCVVRRGKIIAQTPKQITKLDLKDRPTALNNADYAPKNLG